MGFNNYTNDWNIFNAWETSYSLFIIFSGFSFNYLLVAIFSILPNLSPWYTILCSVPLILTGGGPTFLTTIISYIADVSSEDERGTR